MKVSIKWFVNLLATIDQKHWVGLSDGCSIEDRIVEDPCQDDDQALSPYYSVYYVCFDFRLDWEILVWFLTQAILYWFWNI